MKERFKSLGMAYYRGVSVCILVYDMTNKQSFDQIEQLKMGVLGLINYDIRSPLILVANKSDLMYSDKAKWNWDELTQKQTLLLFYGICRNIEKRYKLLKIPRFYELFESFFYERFN